MRCVTVIIVFSFALLANAKASTANLRIVKVGGIGKLVDKAVDDLIDQVLRSSPVHTAELDACRNINAHATQRRGSTVEVRPALRVTHGAAHSHVFRHCLEFSPHCASEAEQKYCLREQDLGKRQLFVPRRRTILVKNMALLAGLVVQEVAVRARADESDIAKAEDPRPTKYLQACQKLVAALKESIAFERTGTKDNDAEYYKKADAGKDAVREFTSTWRDDKRVKDEVSYKAITDTLKELGAFYQKNGPKSYLSQDVRTRLLDLLDVAEKDLGPPVKEQSLFSQVYSAVSSVAR